ncbi:neutral zinc metallopeptidase (plasmid) [Polymorphobacter sp. PAMC 29334]|uniref:neutral zinc metallopeptidase n=1 Tax=Polymorphobacter sp. PAMC 29334 TaxID=2862331 RepID=UPI001C677A57|nr:neutral zinc metallopeptidase [Polymorphobacter sp. PAMC 29334]QYE37244.1 neutral zinc metallopeptidase [Polymorphobacter sp. PAMC 29334]
MLVVAMHVTADPPQPEAEQGSILASTIINSTSEEWSAVFATTGHAYAAPRTIYLQPPRHHPARGFSYLRGIGVAIDLGELTDIERFLGRDADAVIALIIAHEVAHHVQYLNEKRRGIAQPLGSDREQQADCAAGWWLGRANARRIAGGGGPLFTVPDIDRQLPRVLQALDTLKTGHLANDEAQYSTGHGLSAARTVAMRRGLASADVSVCGASVTPLGN